MLENKQFGLTLHLLNCHKSHLSLYIKMHLNNDYA